MIWALGVVLVLLVLTGLHYAYWVRRLTLELPGAVVETLPLKSGSSLELRRLPPPSAPDAPPVLLVHGLGANHRNVDAEPDRSLARLLSSRGRDVWLLTLRSGMPHFSGEQSFRTMVEEDLPLAVQHVLSRTRAQKVDYVGFSMGGILLYAAIGRTVPLDQLRRVALIGSPGKLVSSFKGLAKVPLLGVLLSLVPMGPLSRLAAFPLGRVHTPFHSLVVHKGNATKQSISWAMVNVVRSIPPLLLRDFVGWLRNGGTIEVGGAPILEGLRHVDTPAYFCAGSTDALAPPDSVKAAFTEWGALAGAKKEFRILGRDYGSEFDYGHGDLAIGQRVQEEVNLPVAEFLDADSE